MLSAAALVPYLDAVTIVDRDRIPDGPQPRRGTPQGRHAHLLMSGGARAIDGLVPGTVERLIAAGAHRIGLPSGLVSLTTGGWLRRFEDRQFLITCTRWLLDWVVREQVLGDARISLRQFTDIIDLVGDASRVTGVRVRDQDTQAEALLEADIVVDATGRGSRAHRWLAGFALPAVREDVVDSGLAYATRIFRAPGRASAGFPVINVQPDPRLPIPGQAAALLPVEGGLWLVTVSGTRGGEPSADEDRFVAFARGLRHPIVGDLIATAQPLGPVHASRSTFNRRRYFERLPRWPDGFVVLGDAVATFNPVYGHGMSVAAHGAAALRAGLRRHGLRPGVARRVQRVIGRTVEGAWSMATSQDIRYPHVIGPRPNAVARWQHRYLDRIMQTGTGNPRVAAAVLDTMTLSAPMTRLIAPAVVLATVRGPVRLPLDQPPLTPQELSAAGVLPAPHDPNTPR
jgi:2-polyprenyl-6-methoxyphenol hydroxylase-like FAD-dependent oxidoreductase